MTSEVASDLKFVFRGLYNLYSSASLASIVLCLTNLDGKKERSQISSIDLLASPQVKILIWSSEGGWSLEDHWNSDVTLEKIREGSWDVVVLQGQSQETSNQQDVICTDRCCDSPIGTLNYCRLLRHFLQCS